MVHWFHENEAVGKALVVGLGVIAGYYTIVTTATKMWALAQWALNAAMTANPIGLIVSGIAAVIAAIVFCWEKFAGFRAFLYATWEVIKAIVDIMITHFTALKDIIVGVFTLDKDQITRGMKAEADNMMNAGSKLAEAAKKGWKAGMADFAKDELTKKGLEGTQGFKKNASSVTPLTTSTAAKGKSTAGVQANKAVTINIQIGSLIHDFKISTTNLTESSQKIHDKIVEVLTGAVNDSQLIAGN